MAGRLIAIVLMFVGVGFLAVLTATIASHFVKADQTADNAEILLALRRLEAEIADLKTRVG